MNLNNAIYETTALKLSQYPNKADVDVTFVGRSNVGKSSLINALLNRKNLAKVGQTPGKTKQINFFNIDNSLYFVDLPGYGYSKMSKKEMFEVGQRIETYLATRKQLKFVIMVIDIRHGFSKDDMLMYDYLKNSEMPFMIVASKCDKLGTTKILEKVEEIKMGVDEVVVPFSALKKVGIAEIWREIDKNIV